MTFVNPFAPKPRGVLSDVARVKGLVRKVLGLAEDASVTVSEITCRDASCPGLETVILVMPSGGATRLLRLPGPVSAVSEALIMECAGNGPD